MRSSKPIRTNRLEKSHPDCISLGEAVEERFLKVSKLHLRETGVPLEIPTELNGDLLLWRTMRVRHKSGDYRNTQDELTSTRNIAQWTLEVNCKLTYQPPPKKIQWRS